MSERDGETSRDSVSPEVELGAILAEVIERRRRGERPHLAEYVARCPHLESDLTGHFEMVDLLEGPIPPPASLGEAIAALPETLQHVIFLRNFRDLPWKEIARQVGRAEEELRREYAGAIVRLLAEMRPASSTGTSARDG